MPEQTPTPAQDLAALDRVTELLDVHALTTRTTVFALSRLREEIDGQRERDLILGRALATEHGWSEVARGGDDAIRYGESMRRAVASVGAEIVWPSPDSGEVADRAAGEGSAPKATGVSDDRADWEKLLDGDHPDYILVHPVPPSESTPREKILAEVAAVDLPVPAEAALRGIVNTACEIARGALPGVGVHRRDDIVRAAAMLVLAVERLDGAR